VNDMGTIRDFNRGTVVKLVTPPRWYGKWVVIVCKDKAKRKYVGFPEVAVGKVNCGTPILFQDEDVKWPIGTVREDLVGIGAERHRTEVVPLIRDALERCKCRG